MNKPGRTTVRVALPGGGYKMRKEPLTLEDLARMAGAARTPRLSAHAIVAAREARKNAEPKTCLGCGAKQQPDGSLPCGH